MFYSFTSKGDVKFPETKYEDIFSQCSEMCLKYLVHMNVREFKYEIVA